MEKLPSTHSSDNASRQPQPQQKEDACSNNAVNDKKRDQSLAEVFRYMHIEIHPDHMPNEYPVMYKHFKRYRSARGRDAKKVSCEDMWELYRKKYDIGWWWFMSGERRYEKKEVLLMLLRLDDQGGKDFGAHMVDLPDDDPKRKKVMEGFMPYYEYHPKTIYI
ncbi:MAG: hypothetical protein Q9159_003099 [Coniocarpon cinnabarinum]